MSDVAMTAMQTARALLLEEKQKGLATREGAIALTQLETAILWRECDLLLQNSPNADIAIKSQGLAAKANGFKDGHKLRQPSFILFAICKSSHCRLDIGSNFSAK
jgi:hypothetical protein